MLATDTKLPVIGGAEKRRFVRGMFTAIAPRYDLLNHVLSLNVDKRWRERAVDALGWERRPDGRYLDLCAGTLDLAAALARRSGFRGHVVGADFVKPMLERGRGKADRVYRSTPTRSSFPCPTPRSMGPRSASGSATLPTSTPGWPKRRGCSGPGRGS